jgi:hypothetical protein
MAFRIMMTLFLAASLGGVGGCSAEPRTEERPPAQTEAEPQTGSVPGATATGTVTETMNAGRYTYVAVDTGETTIWAAAAGFDVAVGDTVVVPLEMPMRDFHSETLDRTFPLIYFTSQIVRQGAPTSAAMPPGHPPVTGAAASSHEESSPAESVAPAQGGVTVVRIWADRSSLAGTTVTVRGRVVKFNGGIMGTNWIHLQDGTGSAAEGTHDLTVTTLANASVGDVVTATGTVVTDQDLGAGYTYQVMLKDAELTAD